MKKQSNEMLATVIIPTYNGEDYLDEILKILRKQRVGGDYEILVIDSGSTDRTLKIIEKHAKKDDRITLHEIPNSEFGHGKTRNLGARLAKGFYVLYLSHDAVPAHEYWMSEMLRPFDLNSKVVAVLGKQDPRPKCFPLMRYDIQSVFRGFGPDQGITLYDKQSIYNKQSDMDVVTFYSDVNSATKKDFLLNEISYRDVKYAEDQLFGKDIINAGYIKAYAAAGNVIHSNDMKLGEYKRRIYDETLGLRNAGHEVPVMGMVARCKMILKGALGDTLRIVKDGTYSTKRKVFWIGVNPLFHIEKWRGYNLGSRAELSDVDSKHSLESARKTSN